MMRPALALSVVLAAAGIAPVEAAGRIPYGTRVGMEVTVTKMRGLGSENAIIDVIHSKENAKEFCVQYSQDTSQKCIDDTVRDTRLNDRLSGNCKTGVFTDLFGNRMHFRGKSGKEFPLYSIAGRNGLLDGSGASGYSYEIGQFAALCPNRVDRLDE